MSSRDSSLHFRLSLFAFVFIAGFALTAALQALRHQPVAKADSVILRLAITPDRSI